MSSSNQKILYNCVLSPERVSRIGAELTEKVGFLFNENTRSLFGNIDAEDVLSRSFLSLGVYTEKGDLAGAMSLHNYPNIPALPPWDWEHWLRTLYGINYEDVRHVLWIHLIVYEPIYSVCFMQPLLQALFEYNEFLNEIALVLPPTGGKIDFLHDYYERKFPLEFPDCYRVQTICFISRKRFTCTYKIRRAVEEDNDDLVGMIPKELKDFYGNYYIAEILKLYEETGREVIVAEQANKAVGVLILNPKVNYDLLNEEFELVPYHGLRKPSEDDDLRHQLNRQSQMITLGTPLEEDSNTSANDNVSAIVMEIQPKEHSLSISAEEEENLQTASSEDEFSLVNISSSLLFNFMYDDDAEPDMESRQSIESQYSAVILNDDEDVWPERRDSYFLTDKKSSKHKATPDNLPIFRGHPNAFTLEIASALPDHMNCLYWLFEASFECFPDREYCVVSFPPSLPPCYLTRYFGRIPPRNRSVFPHELYVLHRNVMNSIISVRQANSEDFEAISVLQSKLLKSQTLDTQIKDALFSSQPTFKAFVLLSEQQIIGLAVLRPEQDPDYLEVHYSLESWMNFNVYKRGMHSHLENFIVSPIFQRHNKFFLRELHRLSMFGVFYYHLKPVEAAGFHTQPLVNVIGNMAAVKPTIIQEYEPSMVEEYDIPSTVLKQNFQPFALYLSTARLMSMSRIEINNRIVIVGAGDTSIAFLESLLYTMTPIAMVIFTNVTVLSPHGISYHKQPHKIRDLMFVNNGHLDRRYMDMICLKTYVHVVTGVMTAIDRKEMAITTNDDTHIPYDLLVLLCGEQFQKPPPKKATEKRSEYPDNVFIINTEADAGNALAKLKSVTTQSRNPLVLIVYGHFLEACCCLTALLEFGVTGESLVYIDPCPETPFNPDNRHDHLSLFFNNKEVETAVMDEMKKQGITIYQDYNFVEWQYERGTNWVSSSKFQSKYKIIELDMCVMFMYHTKTVSTKTYQAITRSGLVFDGHLVIDKHCQTNDPMIYSAGTLTKYSRRYYADHLMHKYFSSQEIGYQLGQRIRKKLIPEAFLHLDSQKNKSSLMKPIVHYCKFPGGLHYLSITKPGKPIPLEVAMNKDDYGKVLVTGQCKNLDTQGYFRLHLNKYNTVETITCLAKFELNIQNLISLYGKHERLLNNLMLRFEVVMITDLFHYFKEPSFCAMYHSRFPQLMESFDEIVQELRTPEGNLLVDEIRQKYEEKRWERMDNFEYDEVEQMFKDANLFNILEEKLLDFLQKNYMYLPMYAHPMLVRIIMNDIRNSAFFVQK